MARNPKPTRRTVRAYRTAARHGHPGPTPTYDDIAHPDRSTFRARMLAHHAYHFCHAVTRLLHPQPTQADYALIAGPR